MVLEKKWEINCEIYKIKGLCEIGIFHYFSYKPKTKGINNNNTNYNLLKPQFFFINRSIFYLGNCVSDFSQFPNSIKKMQKLSLVTGKFYGCYDQLSGTVFILLDVSGS